MNGYGVIFDMDGVLVDSTAAHFESWQTLGTEVGIPYSHAVFMATYGMHNRQSIPRWLGRDVSDAEISRLADRKEALYRAAARDTLRPIPGVVELAHRLSTDGWALAVGSSGPLANVTLALEVLGIAPLFQVVSTGDEVREGKPDPGIFLNAARKLNLVPARCAVIEDAPQGIEAAHRAGMFCIAIPTSRPAHELATAEWIADTLDAVSPDGLRQRMAKRSV